MNPLALKVLDAAEIPNEGLTSKTWDAFAAPGAPVMDFVFTVCDNAAGEVCPVWPGQPITAHWGFEDPSRAEGTAIQREAAFVTALRFLRNRISIFLSQPLGSLDDLVVRAKVREIGQSEGVSSSRPSAA